MIKIKVKQGKWKYIHLESLVDSEWMLLDGWHYRVLKRGNAAPHIEIAADSTQSGAASSCHVLPSEKCHITQ
jgi:hypothetical protein